MQWFHAEGKTLAEMKERARAHPLFQEGDLKLMWVLESDVHMCEFSRAMDGTCFECGSKIDTSDGHS